jgi:small GTP-binding protein
MSDTIELQKKIVLLGDPAVGKTSMLRKFVYNEFDDKYVATLGTKVTKKTLTYDNILDDSVIRLSLMIWDVMGQQDYKIFQKSACVGSQGALIVSDISRSETIRNWEHWKSDLFKLTSQIPVIMIGNKKDLEDEHKSPLYELKKISATHKIPIYLTSAKTGENIEKVFYVLGENILKKEYGK